MEKLVIEGNHQLKGEVHISGSKNAVLPVMAAALLVAGETTILEFQICEILVRWQNF